MNESFFLSRMQYLSGLFKVNRNRCEIIYEKIKADIDNLDMITVSAMAIMLSETNAKAQSPYLINLRKTDIKEVLLTFLAETYNATDISQIDNLFNKKYYKKKIRKYLHKIVIFTRRGISDTLPKKNTWYFSRVRISNKQTKIFIDKICDTIKMFESVKYISALSGNNEFSGSKRNYKLDHLNDSYKDALIYLVDFLLSCTCISKMFFIERMVNKMNEESELYRIIENLAKSINDHNIIIKKSRPVYNQFYKAELGGIDGGDYLFGMAVTILVNRIRKTENPNLDILNIDYDPINIKELDNNMKQWLDKLAGDNCSNDIGSLILQRITLMIKNNYGLRTDAFGELLKWEDYYKQRVIYYMHERDKLRYLSGNLDKEMLEMSSIEEQEA